MSKQQTAVEWFSNRAYELFEQYSEGKFDRITLNKFMFEATNKAKEMFEEQMIDFANGYSAQDQYKISAKYYYKENYGGKK